MVIRYRNRKTEKICNDFKYACREFDKSIAQNLAILMENLKVVDHISVFYSNPIFKKYRVHELNGDKQGITSFSISHSYRMEAIVEVVMEEDEIEILEVSNHYGD